MRLVIDAERERREHGVDLAISTGWYAATFSSLTRGKTSRLKPLAHYLRRRSPAPELPAAQVERLMAMAEAWADALNGGGDGE